MVEEGREQASKGTRAIIVELGGVKGGGGWERERGRGRGRGRGAVLRMVLLPEGNRG